MMARKRNTYPERACEEVIASVLPRVSLVLSAGRFLARAAGLAGEGFLTAVSPEQWPHAFSSCSLPVPGENYKLLLTISC